VQVATKPPPLKPKPAAKPKPKAAPAPVAAAAEGDEEEDGPADVCQFCAVQDPKLAEGENMDLHFYHDCPMLCSCAECGQIIEVASVNEHLVSSRTLLKPQLDSKDPRGGVGGQKVAVRTVGDFGWEMGSQWPISPSRIVPTRFTILLPPLSSANPGGVCTIVGARVRGDGAVHGVWEVCGGDQNSGDGGAHGAQQLRGGQAHRRTQPLRALPHGHRSW
jgi:hypothetical protein